MDVSRRQQKLFYCWKRTGHGLQNITQAITNSCNYFIGEMGYRLGMEKLREYLTALAWAKKAGIEIGDYAGTLPETRRAEPGPLGSVPAVQPALYTAAAGPTMSLPWPAAERRYTPTCSNPSAATTIPSWSILLLKWNLLETIDIDSKNLKPYSKACWVIPSPAGKSILISKTASSAGAKTGTAQLGGKKENNVAFAPYDDPGDCRCPGDRKRAGSGAASG